MSAERTTRARELRQSQTAAEALLWQRLRGRRFFGCKFKRQRAFGIYFLDFFCEELNLVVELDGVGHQDPVQIEHDRERTALLVARGLTVLRIPNKEITEEPHEGFLKVERMILQLRRVARDDSA